MSESSFVDDGCLIVTRNFAFADTIGPKKDKTYTRQSSTRQSACECGGRINVRIPKQVKERETKKTDRRS